MKIVVFGGHGTLGKELQKLNPEIICPTRQQVDITNLRTVKECLSLHKPDIVINCAAILDARVFEKNPEKAINTNIVGAANVAIACIETGARLVYISTDYVYKGDRGNYKETDEVLPFNLYAWTKLGGETSAVGVENHLIIRTSFGKSNFAYSQAFIDKWASKDYIDVIAPMIYEAALSPLTGILNLGTERKTLHEYASERNTNVKPVKLAETTFFTPYDTSLNLQKWINYKSEKTIAKPHTECRVCGSHKLTKYLDLGLMPLANNLEFTYLRAREKERFPLQVLFCEDCGLSQLSVVIDPEKMFSYYTYRSSVNAGYVKHCRSMAEQLQDKYGLNKDSFMVDIAGNDGALLKEFKDQIGLRVLNVDPASNLAAIAESQGVETLSDFWSSEVAEKIKSSHSQADLITATNVFAHVDNVKDFVKAASLLLKRNGILVLEFPYLVDFIENMEFDTIYFEHLSYMSVLPLNRLCDGLGMRIIDIEKQDIHGGTIRVTIAGEFSDYSVSDSVASFIEHEYKDGYTSIEKYLKWGRSVHEQIDLFWNQIIKLKKEGSTIAGFAASAKGNTLLNSAKINTDIIDYICDQTPEKIGKFSPKTGIRIVHPQEILKNHPDYLILLSWNFKEALIEKARKIGFKGKFIVPIPTFQIVD